MSLFKRIGIQFFAGMPQMQQTVQPNIPQALQQSTSQMGGISPELQFLQALAGLETSQIPQTAIMQDMSTGGILTDQQTIKKCEQAIKPWLELLALNPKMTKDDLTPEFIQLIKSGLSPAVAYSQGNMYKLNNKISEMQDIIRALQTNAKNNLASIGSLSGDAIHSDSFITGLSK